MNKYATNIIEKRFSNKADSAFIKSKNGHIDEPAFIEILHTLPETCRKICLLYFQHDLSRAAIAQELNISASTVHNRLHKGLYLLKTQFAKKPKNPV